MTKRERTKQIIRRVTLVVCGVITLGVVVPLTVNGNANNTVVDGYYRYSANGNGVKYEYVTEYKCPMNYIGNGTFLDDNGDMWVCCVTDDNCIINKRYILIMCDNGTPDDKYDDSIVEIRSK